MIIALEKSPQAAQAISGFGSSLAKSVRVLLSPKRQKKNLESVRLLDAEHFCDFIVANPLEEEFCLLFVKKFEIMSNINLRYLDTVRGSSVTEQLSSKRPGHLTRNHRKRYLHWVLSPGNGPKPRGWSLACSPYWLYLCSNRSLFLPN